MKLRRALATAAATAVLAPLALLSAPAAFATTGTGPNATDANNSTTSEPTTPGTTDSTDSTDSTNPTDATTPSDTESSTSTEETAPGTTDPDAGPSDTTSPSADTDTETDPGTGRPPASDEPTGEPSESASDEPDEQGEQGEQGEQDDLGPDADVPLCAELDKEFGDADAKVSAGIEGLPGKIVAGSGFHSFELVVTNDSDVDVREVAFYAEVENYAWDEYLSPYVDLQFKNPETGKWTAIGDEDWAGAYFFYAEQLKSKASEKFDLRVSVDAQAPAGDAWSLGAGAYLDNVNGQDCIAAGWDEYDFQVLRPGSDNPEPGTAVQGGRGTKVTVKKPQGAISALPTGSLAETGSSSALPMIGAVGGAAVAVGVGAVFLVRRRKNTENGAA